MPSTVTNFPNGVSSFGAPVLPQGNSLPNLQSSALGISSSWFVDGTNGNDGNDGMSPGSSVKTIGRAVTLAQASTTAGADTIYIYPGTYAETLTVTKNNVTMTAAQMSYNAMPTINSGTGVSITVNAGGFRLIGIRMVASQSTDGIVVAGAGCRFVGCVFDGSSNGATTALVRYLPSSATLSAANNIVTDCLFRSSGGYAIAFDTSATLGPKNIRIEYSRFQNNTGTDIVVNNAGTSSDISIDKLTIQDSVFFDSGKTTVIDLTTNAAGSAGSYTGIITNCFFGTAPAKNTTIKTNSTLVYLVGCYKAAGVIDGTALV